MSHKNSLDDKLASHTPRDQSKASHNFRALDPDYRQKVLEFYRLVRPWFRPSIEGQDVLTDLGPAMLVANHGYFGIDAPLLAERIDHTTGRCLRGAADRLMFRPRFLREFLLNSGIVEGSQENTTRLFEAGDLVIVMPGGSREAMAPERNRYRLMWEGHVGFARAAIRNNVPIVPTAMIGAADLYRQLIDAPTIRSSWVGRIVDTIAGGGKYVPFVPIGVGLLPLPVHLHFIVGDPIFPSPNQNPTELAAQGHAALQQLVADGLKARSEREKAAGGLAGTLDRLLAKLRPD